MKAVIDYSSTKRCIAGVTYLPLYEILSIAALLLILISQLGQALSPDGIALLALKDAVIDPLGVLGNWNPQDQLPCNWTGVGCDSRSKQVVVINLSRCNLSGHITPNVGRLAKLHALYLQFNNFGGPIPDQLANCSRIRSLSLHHNRLAGEIPSQLGYCKFLQALDFSYNSLGGIIPSSFGNLSHLHYLDFSYNSLGGIIPSSFGNLSHLHYLNLSYNQLTGEIPKDGIMPKFGVTSFLGNYQLCGKLGFPACSQLQQPVPIINAIQPPVSPAHSHTQGLNAIKIAAICAGAFLIFKLCIVFYVMHKRSVKQKNREINLGSGGKLVMFQGGTSVTSSRKLLKLICKLGKKQVIGEGGYGVVYKLVLNDSTVLAVKKLKQCLESVRGFEAELETLGDIKHRNLVKLHGYCTSSTVKLLIYEYLPNGTLEDLLHGRTSNHNLIDWTTRFKIALGVARGLEYLHHGCDPRIIHRDISSSNVLLDADLEPHLSDFGLAKLIGLYDTHVTATVAGTFGYIAPECADSGRATDKVDVYSYGVLLLEILSGRRPADISLGEDGVNLAGMVRKLQEEGQEENVIEKFLKETAPQEELKTTLWTACLCISKNAEDRPSMRKVVEYLKNNVSIGSVSKQG